MMAHGKPLIEVLFTKRICIECDHEFTSKTPVFPDEHEDINCPECGAPGEPLPMSEEAS
jgi:hypothetical protein